MGMTYVVCAQASSRLQITVADPPQPAVAIDVGFAEQIEAVEDVAQLCSEPSRKKHFGDWMIWMVHRAYLNDPSLIELDFTSMHMPSPHEEKRIAPKLMAALKWNTNIELLLLASSNLQPASGFELADALAENKTLRIVDIESNCLDSMAVKEIAVAVGRNKNTQVEQLMVSHQKQGKFFGRPTEEAFAQMMSNNDTRRRPQKTPSSESRLAPLEDKQLKLISLCGEPVRCGDDVLASASTSAGASEAEEEDMAEAPVARTSGSQPSRDVIHDYVVRYERLPSFTQLQTYLRNAGATPPTHKEAMPILKDCRGRLLDAAVLSNVGVTDVFGTVTSGVLRSWTERNDVWTVEVGSDDGRRYAFQSRHAEPSMAVSGSWAAFLQQ